MHMCHQLQGFLIFLPFTVNYLVFMICIVLKYIILFLCINLIDGRASLRFSLFSFFVFRLSSLRAAQKLNLASKKKKQKTAVVPVPVTSSSPSCDPPLFPTNFSAALLLAPPPAPPCLLRAANKIKDTPGLGKVKEKYFLFDCIVGRKLTKSTVKYIVISISFWFMQIRIIVCPQYTSFLCWYVYYGLFIMKYIPKQCRLNSIHDGYSFTIYLYLW